MVDLWMPGATRLPLPDADSGMQTQYPSRAIAHVTWSSASTINLRRYFSENPEGRSKAPHLLWDPFTGRVWQFYPASSRSKSVADKPGGTRTNRTGRYCIQIEAHFRPGHTYGGKKLDKLTDTPCAGWEQIQRWCESLGIPSRWPAGMPNFRSDRDAAMWASSGGWYGHSQVPENTHTDPGPWPAFRTVKPTPQEDDMTPAQAELLTYISKQVKAVAELVVTLDKRRAEQIKVLGQAVDANVDEESAEIDAKLAKIHELLESPPNP